MLTLEPRATTTGEGEAVRPRSVRTRRASSLVVALVAVTATLGFGIANALTSRGDPLPLDSWWMDAVALGQRGEWAKPALVLHEIGAGLPAFAAAAAIAGALLLRLRPWGTVYFVAAAILSTALVEVLKNSIGRPRPADALIDVGYGSYPSGHSARAAMIAVTLGILFPRLWVWMLGMACTVAMMFSRTQLGAHWLTDTIGGALTGAAVALLCFALLAGRLEAEGAREHPPPWKSET